MSKPVDVERSLTLHDELTEILREETGLHESLASQIAEAVLRGLCRRRGPGVVYVPKGIGPTVSADQIRAAYNGQNRDDVCKRFGISRATFYRAISARRESLTD